MNDIGDYVVGYEAARYRQRYMVLQICGTDDVLAFIAYFREHKLLDVHVAAITYHQAWNCFDIVRNSEYNMAKNEIITLYVAKNLRLSESSVCHTYRMILQAGGRWSKRTSQLIRKYRSKDLLNWTIKHGCCGDE